VASGKSTLAQALAERMRRWPGAPAVEQIATDGFLHPNAVLEAAGTLNRKGFPETYDVAAMTAALAALRRGRAHVPGYSHVIYDIDPGLAREIVGADVVIVEGLGLHHDWRAIDPRPLDVLVYLDAEEADIEAWYVERFARLWAAAEHDSTSFYARFRAMDESALRDFAAMVWRQINLPNLRDHVLGARSLADVVVKKGRDHAIVSVDVAARPA
jgi:type I pantothenate kinase